MHISNPASFILHLEPQYYVIDVCINYYMCTVAMLSFTEAIHL